MHRSILRGAATVLVLSAAFASAGPAAAVPRILVFQSDYRPVRSTVIDLGISFEKNDPAPGKIAIALQGGTLDVGMAVGTDIGFAVARVLTAPESPFGGKTVTLKGSLRVVNPVEHLVDGAACTGQALHDAVWLLSFARPGLGLSLTLYVDRRTSGLHGRWLITACPLSPDVREDQGGAPYGADIQQLYLRIARVYQNGAVPGVYHLWALFTPYIAGTNTLNPHGTVEARALTPIPYRLLLWRGRAQAGSVRLAGTLSAAQLRLAGARLDVYAGDRPDRLRLVGRTSRLTQRGGYSFTRKSSSKTTYFQVVFGPFDVTHMPGASFCGGTTEAPLGCVSATMSEIDSGILRVPARR